MLLLLPHGFHQGLVFMPLPIVSAVEGPTSAGLARAGSAAGWLLAIAWRYPPSEPVVVAAVCWI